MAIPFIMPYGIIIMEYTNETNIINLKFISKYIKDIINLELKLTIIPINK